jgi:rhodanese-related sulfurtransferase
MSYRRITPDEADAQMKSGDGTIYLDVRSRREFIAGHPDGAINIPILEPDDSGRMVPNPEFLAVAEKVLPRDARLVVGCQVGKRSDAACRVLEEAGFTDLANVEGGFGGAKDILGRLVQPGWLQLGLPVSDDNGDGVSYESLREKALGG